MILKDAKKGSITIDTIVLEQLIYKRVSELSEITCKLVKVQEDSDVTLNVTIADNKVVRTKIDKINKILADINEEMGTNLKVVTINVV